MRVDSNNKLTFGMNSIALYGIEKLPERLDSKILRMGPRTAHCDVRKMSKGFLVTIESTGTLVERMTKSDNPANLLRVVRRVLKGIRSAKRHGINAVFSIVNIGSPTASPVASEQILRLA